MNDDVFDTTFSGIPEDASPDEGLETPVDDDDAQLVNDFVLPPSSQAPEVNAVIINRAYEGLKTATLRKQAASQEFIHAQNNLSRMRAVLEFHKQEAILDGKNVGKNAEQREAFARQLFFDEYENVARQENETMKISLVDNYASMAVRLWQIECDRIDKLMDLLTMEYVDPTQHIVE